MIKLTQQLHQIDQLIEHYSNGLNSLLPQISNMKSELKSYYNNKSMDGEVKQKLDKELNKIKMEYECMINNVKNSNKELRMQCESTLNVYEDAKNNKKTELMEPLEYLRDNQHTIVNQLESCSRTKEFSPIYSLEEIQEISLEELLDYVDSVVETSKEILDISPQTINVSSIPDDFWFIAGKREFKSKSVEDIARALNIVIVLLLLGKLSNVIIGGLATYSAYLMVQNRIKLSPIKEYKNYIYTLYQYDKEIEQSIEDAVSGHLKDKEENIKARLRAINKQEELKVNSLLQQKQEDIEEAEDKFNREIDKHIAVIKAEMNVKLKELENVAVEMEQELNNIFEEIIYRLDDLRLEIQEKIAEMNQFELEVVNENMLLDLDRVHLGYEVEDQTLNKFERLPFGSYLFIYGDGKEKMQKFIQYLQIQFVGRLRGDLLKVNILDPVDLGKGLNTSSYKDMGLFYSKSEVDEEIDSQIKKFTLDAKNILLGYDDIRIYNEEKHSTGSSLYPYTLNVIQNVDIFSDISKYKQLLRTTQSGIINFVLLSDNVLNTAQKNAENNEVEMEEFIDIINLFPVIFNDLPENEIEMKINHYYSVEKLDLNTDEIKNIAELMNNKIDDYLSEINIIAYDHNIEPLHFSPFEVKDLANIGSSKPNFLARILDDKELRGLGKMMEQNYKNAKSPIFFFDDFMERVTKGKPMFSSIPLDGVNFYFGYENGDVDKPFPVPFNDYNIHAYLGGRTGMGKSNASNVGVNSALYLYSPESLEIYYMDFKEAEGAKYMRNITPHFRCIATTSDAGYLLSLFEHIDKRMRDRQRNLLPMYNAGKLKDIRERYEDYLEKKEEYAKQNRDYDQEIYEKFEGNEDRIREFKGRRVSEIVIVIDEFTEALKAEPEVVKEILRYIDSFSRLGRATGVHLFLMSQDVPDKIDAGTMGQIVTRLSLPVTTGATSKTLVGNESAADPDYQTKGNMLFNDRGGDLKANVRMKVPIIQPEDMDANLSKIRDYGIEQGYPIKCVLFNHEDPVLFKDDLLPFLEEKCDKLYDDKENVQQMVIGGNVLFTEEPAPVGFSLGIDEGENIVIISQSSKKRIEIENTLVSNFAEVRGDNSYLLLFRGNKDFNNHDLSLEYKNKFKDVIEIEEVADFIQELENVPLRNLEKIIDKRGFKIFEDLNNIDVIEDETYLLDLTMLESIASIAPDIVKTASEIGYGTPITKSIMTKMLNSARNSLPTNIIVVEGVDRVSGLGFGLDYSQAEHIKHLIMTAPYYNTYVIFTSSVEPQSFSKLEECFRHRLLGNLDTLSLAKFKFMREIPTLYGGYSNIIAPNKYFKYKIYNIDGVKEDIADDNRILV